MDNRERSDRYWRQYGEWMTTRRKEMLPDKWTQARLADEMTRSGHKVTRNWVNQVESGERPSSDFVQAVERLLGRPPEFETNEPVDQSALIEALDRQTAALTALVGELQREREEGRDVATAFDRAAVRLLTVLRPGDSAGSDEQSALRETTG